MHRGPVARWQIQEAGFCDEQTSGNKKNAKGDRLLLRLGRAPWRLRNRGADFKTPKTDLPAQWREAERSTAAGKIMTGESPTGWWRVFKDPVLNSLIEKALAQNLSLQIAGLRIYEARAELGFVSGSIYPQKQSLEAGAHRVKASKNAANTLQVDGNYVDYAIGFDVGWELDFWGRFRRAIQSADSKLRATIADYDNAMVLLQAEVARVYIMIRTLEKRISLLKRNAAIQERSLEIAQRLFAGGMVTELDVQQARALLENTRALVPRLETSLQEAKNALCLLLGTSPGQLPKSLEQPGAFPVAPVRAVVGIPAELLRRRPDIRRMEMLAAAQCGLIGVSKADLYPHFTLIGSIGLKASEASYTKAGGITGSNIGDLFGSDSLQLFAGPSIRWDILNYGRLKNRVRVQDARFQQLLVQYEISVLNALRETENAMAGFVRAQEQNSLLQKSVGASERAVDISMLQYREGMVDYQRVLSAQAFLTQQQDRQTEASSLAALNLVSLYKALGGGWQVPKGNDFISPRIKKQMRDRTDWGDLLD